MAEDEQAGEPDPGQQQKQAPKDPGAPPDGKDQSGQDQQKGPGGKGKKKGRPPVKLLVIGAIILVVGTFFGYRYWQHASTHEETDDAYTTGNTHQISARIAGTVEQVLIDDNWHVEAGQPLVKLDARDYEVALQKNRAQLEQAQAQVSQSRAAEQEAAANLLQRRAQVTQAEAQVVQAQANFDIATINYKRNSSLFQKDLRAVAKQEVDTTKASLDAAQGSLDAAKATADSSKAQVEAAKASVDSAHAQSANAVANVAVAAAAVRDAELQVSYCTVIAPVSGRIAQKTVQSGNRLSVGQSLMAVVEDDVWILANLKETQLEKVQVGQPVEIKVDALPHFTFTGRVDSLQPGTGSSFALLPPDNATGNFIKIVQRVPVKILFDPDSIKDVKDKIVPGLSTVPTIVVTEKPVPEPYRSSGEEKAPFDRPGRQAITQMSGVPAPGVMR